MALPDKVIEQLGRESSHTPGWSFGIISFAGGILFIVIFLYAGLTWGYKPYLDSQTQKVEDQINTLGQSLSPTDQANLVNFYSQVSNLRNILRNHAATSRVFSWIEQNTEQNVYFTSFGLTQGNQLALTVNARTENDMNQQIAMFEGSPQVQKVGVSGITTGNGTIFLTSNVTLTLDPSVFTASQ